MIRDLKLTEKIKKYCKKIGIDLIGFADPKLFDRFPSYNRPEYYLKKSQTAIIIGMYLHDVILDAWNRDPKSNKSFQFADLILQNYCRQIKNFLFKRGYDSKIIPYSPGLYLKDSAALAGIGCIGKNNLLITEQFGPQIRLRALITIAALKCGTPILESKFCLNCNKCIEACPAQAFSNGKYNKDKCYTYQISHLRKLSKFTSIWCNLCINSCPIGKKIN